MITEGAEERCKIETVGREALAGLWVTCLVTVVVGCRLNGPAPDGRRGFASAEDGPSRAVPRASGARCAPGPVVVAVIWVRSRRGTALTAGRVILILGAEGSVQAALEVKPRVGEGAVKLGQLKELTDNLQHTLLALASQLAGTPRLGIEFEIVEAAVGSLSLGLRAVAEEGATIDPERVVTTFTADLRDIREQSYRTDRTTGLTYVNPSGPNPGSPNIGSPMTGTLIDGPSVFFSWNRIPGDTGANTTYQLFVMDLSRQMPALNTFTPLNVNYYQAFFRAEGTRYDALVVSDQEGTRVIGPAVGFNVGGQSMPAPTMVSPVVGGTVAQGNVQVEWSPVPGATLYEYFVAVTGESIATARGVTTGLLAQVPLAAAAGLPTSYSAIARACPSGATCVAGGSSGWGDWSNIAGTGTDTFTVTP